jgi:hypothetical protein
MHTAFELKQSMFSVEVGGKASTRDELLDWEVRDRLGVIINSPFGALGAGLLILLSVTAFYDMPTQRRRMRPLYPSIYLFHVGRPWGFHGEFDFWPDRKEIVTGANPADVLRSINSHGITHLAVPDGVPRDSQHRYKEPEEALDRLKQSYAYATDGSARDADVHLQTSATAVLRNFERTVHLADTLTLREKSLAEDPRLREGTPAGEDSRRYVTLMRERLGEVSPADAAVVRAAARIDQAIAAARLDEHLRRIDSKTAIGLLG